MRVSAIPPAVQARRRTVEARLSRWAVRKMDPNRFMAAIVVSTWRVAPPEEGRSVQEQVDEIRGILTNACDVSMPRVKSRTRGAAYWWTEDIAELRQASVRARRAWTRARRERGDVTDDAAGEDYRAAQQVLAKAIRVAKEWS
ncbi:uncharacterized protein [Temnothorax nylanderi]|uniref:uncharacterized protein n=1 Tax=Temnothorax nylanderi TaxID=102681 RepID=UPI003A88493E